MSGRVAVLLVAGVGRYGTRGVAACDGGPGAASRDAGHIACGRDVAGVVAVADGGGASRAVGDARSASVGAGRDVSCVERARDGERRA